MLGWLLEKPIAFGSANTLRCLPLESQLPLKPCFALQPFQFKGNCDSSDLLLDFCYSFASQMWATRPHLGSIFEKLLHRKTFRFMLRMCDV